MITESHIKSLVSELIQDTDRFVVDVKVNPANRIRIEIDSVKGISIDECVRISRHVEQNLDREAEDFELQVTSPGLDQPYKVRDQYLKNVGKLVNVATNDGREINGLLNKANGDGIEVVYRVQEKVAGKKSKPVEKSEQLKYEQIKSTKTNISFNKKR